MYPTNNKTILLHNGIQIPILGYRIQSSSHVYTDVTNALEQGYRHFDLPCQSDVEQEFSKAINDAGIARDNIFVTIKISNDDHSYALATHAFQHSLKRLKMDYVDLLLIDWPNPKKFRSTYESSLIETWKALEDIYKKGSARAIGVANFEARHIEFVLDHCEISPMVNEARIYPGFPFLDNVECAMHHKIQTIGYLPNDADPILHGKEITIFANKYKVTPTEIYIRYLLSKNIIALVPPSNNDQLQDNYRALTITMSEEDIKYLEVIKNHGPENINPDEADF